MIRLRLIAITVMVATVSPAAASISQFNENLATYVADAQPFITSLGMNDATATTTGFPFVTLGITTGVALAPNPNSTLAKGISGSDFSDLPIGGSVLPQVYPPTIFGRIGLPGGFDIGAKLGSPIEFSGSGATLKATTIGGELRYTFMEQGLLIPGFSVAGGFDYSNGSLEFKNSKDYGFGTVNGKSKTEWSQTNFHATARTGVSVLFFSLVAGLQVYTPTGDVKSSFNGTVSSVATSDSATKSTSDLRAKFLGGVYFNLPFVRLGVQYDQDFTTDLYAVAATAQFVF